MPWICQIHQSFSPPNISHAWYCSLRMFHLEKFQFLKFWCNKVSRLLQTAKLYYFIYLTLTKIVSTLNACFVLKVPTMEEYKILTVVVSSFDSLVWPDPSTQGTYWLEIHKLYIGCLSPIDKQPMHMQDSLSVFTARLMDIKNSKKSGWQQCMKANTTSGR